MNILVASLIEHLTELVTNTEVICDNCGWKWSKTDGGDDLYICHKCGCDNTPDNINELGEGNTKPFKWYTLGSYSVEAYVDKLKEMEPMYGDGTYQYAFKSDNDDYVVNVFIRTIPPSATLDDKHQMYIAFGFGLRYTRGDEMTNYQEQYRVMATILDIVADFVNIVDDNIEDVVIKEIQFHPKADNGTDGDTNSRRGKLYKEYIDKNLDKFHRKYKLNSTSKAFYLTPVYVSSIKESKTKTWDLKEGIVFLSKYMLDNKINIKPLPKVNFIKDDGENASDMLGKTAYYNPSEKEVVLFTLGRHPKDVCRSFTHEMIHHIQNLEGRLEGIGTSNTNEDDYLQEIEKEAYLQGNITFRNWEDGLKNKEQNTKVMAEGKYDKLSNTVSSDIFRAWKEAINSGEDGVQFKKKYQALGGEFDVEATLELMFETGKMEVLDTTGAGTDKLGDFIRIDIDIDEEMLPQEWEEISMTLKDIVRHEIEHLTHNIGSSTSNPNKGMEDDLEKRDWIKGRKSRRNQYFHLEKEIDANLQGLLFRAKKERKPFADVVNTYLDAQQLGPRQKNKILNMWRERMPALGIRQSL
jgi:hypothetical protein